MAENQGTLEISEKIHTQAEKKKIFNSFVFYAFFYLPLSGAKKLPRLDHLLLDQSPGCHSVVTCETGYKQSNNDQDIIKYNKLIVKSW